MLVFKDNNWRAGDRILEMRDLIRSGSSRIDVGAGDLRDHIKADAGRADANLRRLEEMLLG